MNRRFLKLLTLWMLPLLVARAIVPVGFMFMSDSGGLRLMFCPSVAQPMSMDTQASAHAGHAMHHDMQAHAAHMQHAHDDGSANIDHDKTPCPFSLVAAVARLDLTYVAVLATLVGERFDLFETLPNISAGPVQSLPIRGPPVYS
jgi:hypothetical protein